MKALLNRIHARVGDLWWYSAMIFLACRSGDVINAFIGLWLVPKYVGSNELGAVLPLQQLSAFFTLPLAVVTFVFTKFVNTYATKGENGKVKSLIRDVLVVSSFVFLLCIGITYLLAPFFYERLRVVSGLLTILILTSGFVGAISSLFGSALQGLKRFKTLTLTGLFTSPVRLITLLIAMPIRPLSGYILGQTTPNAYGSVLGFIDLRRTLAKTIPDTSWRHDWRAILSYARPIILFVIFNTIFATLTTTIYRQRLPELESAAYYLLSRFSETAGYLGASISVVLFPLAAEAYENGKENIRLLKNACLGTAICTVLLAIIFFFAASSLLSLTETWATYKNYSHLLSPLTLIVGCGSIIGAYTSYEMACRRFKLIYFLVVYNILFCTFLVSFTGYEYFRGLLPDTIVNFMGSVHLAQLNTLTWANLISAFLQIIAIPFLSGPRNPQHSPRT